MLLPVAHVPDLLIERDAESCPLPSFPAIALADAETPKALEGNELQDAGTRD
jgi:hypothetical protein